LPFSGQVEKIAFVLAATIWGLTGAGPDIAINSID
jgi:hypothetical protein